MAKKIIINKPRSEKKNYNVTFYYHTNVTVKVEAQSEEEALALAESEVTNDCYTNQILEGLQQDSSPDVEEDLDDNERLEQIAELKRKLNED